MMEQRVIDFTAACKTCRDTGLVPVPGAELPKRGADLDPMRKAYVVCHCGLLLDWIERATGEFDERARR